jgi:hypothetical protein
MTDDRPRPEYGEYATPEQVAAAMGRRYVPPVEVPVPPVPPVQASTDQPSADEPMSLRIPGHPIDRFATIFQLGIGLVFLLNSNYFQFGEVYNSTASEVGLPTSVSSTIDSYGWLLLTANIVLYLATAVTAYLRLRRGKLAFWIPFLGFAVFYTFLLILITVFTRS